MTVAKSRAPEECISSFLGDTGELEPGRGRAQRWWHPCLYSPGLHLQKPGAPPWEMLVQGEGSWL